MPDRRIRLLLADPLSCNPRNARYGQLHAAGPGGEVSALHPAISARGEDVSEAALLQLLSGQSSYAKSADSLLGLHVVDEFSHAMGQRLGEPGAASKTLHDLLANLQSDVKLSTVSSMSTGGDALLKNLTVGDFFA
ncbi:hypothetical protein F751_3498 [Auxenochlorella protothecoides]|uniref:Uncharacterized protein n=1 Tax=Auxenochlorella protothecoides TaxID=3075 RepID=A0A087SSG4_AUXPR|nr:hypothetical protein F751_3498 [Auxenochlorella protothecoides]KFM28668.1 hypothetical protein F751_3498 [Auxenochlorella protothecoides]